MCTKLAWRVVGFFAVVAVIVMTMVALANASECPDMQALAQRCASWMAANDRLEHCGMMGQRAENVAYGHSTQGKTFAQWRHSKKIHREPGCGTGCVPTSHALNMQLPGCRGVASAVSRSGKSYWA